MNRTPVVLVSLLVIAAGITMFLLSRTDANQSTSSQDTLTQAVPAVMDSALVDEMIVAGDEQPSFHEHAGFHVYVDGQFVDFSAPDYMHLAPCGHVGIPDLSADEMTVEDRVHLHDQVGDVAHVHAAETSWQMLMDSIRMEEHEQLQGARLEGVWHIRGADNTDVYGEGEDPFFEYGAGPGLDAWLAESIGAYDYAVFLFSSSDVSEPALMGPDFLALAPQDWIDRLLTQQDIERIEQGTQESCGLSYEE